jgi:uncharacterized membrane protein YdjX (TVP38/TMEM64 family)
MKERADTSVGGASKWRAWVVLSVLLLTVILVPFFLFEQDMNAWVDRVLRTSVPGEGAAAAVISLLALDVFLPIPSSIVSTAAGAMLGFALGVAASTAGMTLGCFLAHFCGRRFGSPLMRRIVRDRDLEEVAEQFRRGAIWALATLRPVPVLAEASALFAGVSGVPLSKYMGVTTLANAGISAVYCAVGANALESGSFLLAFAGSIALPAVAMLISRWVHRRR